MHKNSKKDMDDENEDDYMSDWQSEAGGNDDEN